MKEACTTESIMYCAGLTAVPQLLYPEATKLSGFFIAGAPTDRSSSVGWK